VALLTAPATASVPLKAPTASVFVMVLTDPCAAPVGPVTRTRT
jgi:hypothetical protein